MKAEVKPLPPVIHTTMSVRVLLIEHENGTEIYVCNSQEAAMRCLHQYVRANWESAGLGKMPNDREKAIDKYFEALEDAGSHRETYGITEQDVVAVEGEFSMGLKVITDLKGIKDAAEATRKHVAALRNTSDKDFAAKGITDIIDGMEISATKMEVALKGAKLVI